MRDVRDFKLPFTRSYVGPYNTNTQTGAVQSVRSQRSDIVSLAPPPYGVTGYEAFFMTASYSSGETIWRNRFATGDERFTWTHGELPESVWRVGCNSLLRPEIPAWATNQVRSRMDNQVREDLDISVFAGEARETGRFLVQSLSTVLQLVRGLERSYFNLNPPRGRRGHYGSFKELLALTVRSARQQARNGSKLASAYLWYMYALRPLVSDVMKISSHWDERLNAPISKRLFAAVELQDFRPPGSATRTSEGSFRRGVKSGADAVVLNPEALRASQYGLTSPLALAWELTTLSFVVDWFTGIGAFLRTLEMPVGVAIVNYYETQWVDCKFVYSYDVYSDLYKSQYTLLKKPDKQTTFVRLKCMLRQTANHILPAPPFLSLGRVGSQQAASLLAIIIARSS